MGLFAFKRPVFVYLFACVRSCAFPLAVFNTLKRSIWGVQRTYILWAQP